MRQAARPLDVDLRIFQISKPGHIDDGLAWVTVQGVEALVLTSDPSLLRRGSEITRFAIAKRLPTIADAAWLFVEPRPLLWYAASFDALTRQVAP